MKTWVRVLLLASAVTPLWLNPLAWRLAFSSVPAVGHAGNVLIQLEFGFGLLLLVPIVACVICPVGLFFRKFRPHAILLLVWAVTYTGAYFGGMEWRSDINRTQLLRVAENAQPLVNAITAYQADHGKPPATLDELVPKYIDRVPETGMGARPEFRYWVGKPKQFHGNDWALVANPPFVFFGAESFYYYPRQNYAEAGFGPVGNWGYFGD